MHSTIQFYHRITLSWLFTLWMKIKVTIIIIDAYFQVQSMQVHVALIIYILALDFYEEYRIVLSNHDCPLRLSSTIRKKVELILRNRKDKKQCMHCRYQPINLHINHYLTLTPLRVTWILLLRWRVCQLKIWLQSVKLSS